MLFFNTNDKKLPVILQMPAIITSLLLITSFNSTADDCTKFTNITKSVFTFDGKNLKNLASLANTLSDAIIELKGCNKEAEQAATELAKRHFKIAVPAEVGAPDSTLYINKEHLEGWQRKDSETSKWPNKFKLSKPEKVYDADSKKLIVLYHIAVVSKKRPNCLDVFTEPNYGNPVVSDICEMQSYVSLDLPADLKCRDYPELWQLKEKAGKIQFIAYKAKPLPSYQGDIGEAETIELDGEQYLVYQKLGAMGWNNDSRLKEPDYKGWADVQADNTRAWQVYDVD